MFSHKVSGCHCALTRKTVAYIQKKINESKLVNIRSDYTDFKCSLLNHKVQIANNISNIYVLDEVNMDTNTQYVQTSGHEVKGQLAHYLKVFVSSHQ